MSTIKSSSENLTLNADGAGNDIIFESNGAEKASLTDAGVFTATSFSGSGANLTSLPISSNGSWTPIIGGASSESGQSYDVQIGRYIKVGDMVAITCAVRATTIGTISGNLEIQGLPYTIASDSYGGGAKGYLVKLTTTASHDFIIRNQVNTTTCTIWECEYNGDTSTALTSSAVEDGSMIEFTTLYRSA